jgi:zinc transport system substrate-binding protein
MVVIVIGPDGLEAGEPVAGVHALDEPKLRERVEGPVDARHPDRVSRGRDPVVDLLRRPAAVLAVEVLDHRATRAAAAKTRSPEPLECLHGPVGHGQTIAILILSGTLAPVLSRTVLVCGLVGVLTATGCGGGASDDTVVAAFYPLAFAATQVAGPGADVVDLTPPGAEPHDLELSPRDVGRVRDAALVVYAGGGFQPAVQQAVEGRNGPSLDVLAHAGTVSNDPHVWLDPVRFAGIVRQIASALRTPTAADALVARLDALDRAYRRGLAHCTRREIVTSHAAFGYLAERYGLVQVPLVGLQPEAEPGPRAIERLVDEVRSTGATTVFSEPLASAALADDVAREAGATTARLDPLEGLTAAETDAGADYFTVMHENLQALRTALGCR